MFTRLLDATSALGVRSEADYRLWQAGQLAHRDVAHVHLSDVTRFARVDHGRWIVDCSCGCGLYVRRGWQLACCIECGAQYHDVRFPVDADEIERLLLARSKRENQSWWPSESVEQLQRENAAYMK